jgi:hypothetical protein
MENTNAGYALSWDDPIQNDSTFVLLPEGDYDFEVVEFERARHAGSEKLPPCNKAIIHIKVNGKDGSTIIKHNLFLHSTTEGMLCAFFTAIGQRKHGEKANMNWNAIIGSKGRAKVGIRKYTNDKGQELEFNEIKRFYDPTENKGFEPGRF